MCRLVSLKDSNSSPSWGTLLTYSNMNHKFFEVKTPCFSLIFDRFQQNSLFPFHLQTPLVLPVSSVSRASSLSAWRKLMRISVFSCSRTRKKQFFQFFAFISFCNSTACIIYELLLQLHREYPDSWGNLKNTIIKILVIWLFWNSIPERM